MLTDSIHVLPFADSIEGELHMLSLCLRLTWQGSLETSLMSTFVPTSSRLIDPSARVMSFRFAVECVLWTSRHVHPARDDHH